MGEMLPLEVPMDPATDEAIRRLRRDRDELILAVASLRSAILTVGKIAIDSKHTEIYRLSRIASLCMTTIRAGRGVERRTTLDMIRAWWQTHRAR